MWATRGPLSEPPREDMPRVAHVAGAAMRRRQRRLRQFLRHERLTVAMLLAERDHHTAPRGQKKARSGEGGNETHNTAEFRETPPPPPFPNGWRAVLYAVRRRDSASRQGAAKSTRGPLAAGQIPAARAGAHRVDRPGCASAPDDGGWSTDSCLCRGHSNGAGTADEPARLRARLLSIPFRKNESSNGFLSKRQLLR